MRQVELRGKVVVITGAGSGIGRATALLFAREGARLHLVDLDREMVGEVAAEAERLGAVASEHLVDCRDAEAMERLAAEIFDAPEGRVDVLHNNAGVCAVGSVEELSLDDWHWTVDTNLWGVVNGIRAFLPGMIEQGGGHIVNTASAAGLFGLPMVAPYVTSKFAIVGLSEALHAELAIHDIRVTAICPGAVRTHVLDNARLALGADATAVIKRGLETWLRDPDGVARCVVRAVKRRQSFVACLGAMLPLWITHRLSVRLYLALSRSLTTWAKRKLDKPPRHPAASDAAAP